MKEDPELGYILEPSVPYKDDIPDGWFYTSRGLDLYDTKELEQIAIDEFPWLHVEDVFVSNPCIFTADRGFMFIGFIVKIILSGETPLFYDSDGFDFLRRFHGKDYICFICQNNAGELESICDIVDYLNCDETLKVTQWPFCVMLPDSTL